MQKINSDFMIQTFDVGPMQNLIYLIWDVKTRFTAIVDPAWDISEVETFIEQNNLYLKKILLTHSHHDHINSIDRLLAKYDLEIHLNKHEMLFWDKSYDNCIINYGGDIINLGTTKIESIHTPGHTPGSTCYSIGNQLVAGDTLFVFGCGRCDLHGGNPEEMFSTLRNLKSKLDTRTLILPGHDYSVKKTSTMLEQISGNPFFHFNQLDKFVEYRMKVHDEVRQSPYDAIKE